MSKLAGAHFVLRICFCKYCFRYILLINCILGASKVCYGYKIICVQSSFQLYVEDWFGAGSKNATSNDAGHCHICQQTSWHTGMFTTITLVRITLPISILRRLICGCFTNLRTELKDVLKNTVLTDILKSYG